MKIYIDAAVKGNPGEAGIGVICKDENENIVFKISKYIGKATNNEAEYIALIEALKEAKKRNFKNFKIYSDSKLIVNQVNDNYKLRNRNLAKYYKEAKSLMSELEGVELIYILREKNKEADILASNSAMLGK